jgi:beta-RFAP synthase
MLCVRTASRLHFGLITPAASPPRRRFGGAGLMIADPGLSVHFAEAAAWSASGPLAARALDFARRFCDSLERDALRPGQPQRLTVERAAPEHAGLGTGTQLGLAVARGLADAWGLNEYVPRLAARVGRGRRSALGVHGFERGGFLVDAGKRDDEALAPLVAHAAFPDAWRVVLLRPRQGVGLHTAEETAAFARLDEAGDPAHTDALCRLVLLGMLPALTERDLSTFGEALYEFNHRVGEQFAAVQGGPYAGPLAEFLVAFVRGQGVRGTGQSSWGPTLFAVVEDEGRADDLAAAVKGHFGAERIEVRSTRASNRGATREGTLC